MVFEIGFNRYDENDKKSFYEFIGAKMNTNSEYGYYEIEIKGFEELEVLMEKINMKLSNNKFQYSAIVSFDNPCIYLDSEC
jgi:uncharacterized protein YsxB (DUF464 family)